MRPSHLLLFFVATLHAQSTIHIPSSLDRSLQPAAIWFPTAPAKPVPLIVHLHSWSSHYDTTEANRGRRDPQAIPGKQGAPVSVVRGSKEAAWQIALAEAKKRNWAFLAPEFRGPNDRPESCASPLARQDILDAVKYMTTHYQIDKRRIFLLGGSGGGHMTLIMATHSPKTWRAASAWVPITDLAAWYAETKQRDLRYWRMLEACIGKLPNEPNLAQYRLRSPLPFLHKAKNLLLDIQTGIHDGHTGSVPVSHSLLAFNALARANRQPSAAFPQADIDTIVNHRRLPAGYPAPPSEPRRTPILHRRTTGKARLTLFEGGHETDFPAAFLWFDTLVR